MSLPVYRVMNNVGVFQGKDAFWKWLDYAHEHLTIALKDELKDFLYAYWELSCEGIENTRAKKEKLAECTQQAYWRYYQGEYWAIDLTAKIFIKKIGNHWHVSPAFRGIAVGLFDILTNDQASSLWLQEGDLDLSDSYLAATICDRNNAKKIFDAVSLELVQAVSDGSFVKGGHHRKYVEMCKEGLCKSS